MRQPSPQFSPDRMSGIRSGASLRPLFAVLSPVAIALSATTAMAAPEEAALTLASHPLHDIAHIPHAGEPALSWNLPAVGLWRVTERFVAEAQGVIVLADDSYDIPLPPPAYAPVAEPTAAYSGSMEPCLMPHGQRDLYRAGLMATGWVDISEAGRPVAIAMLADAFLPITGAMDGLWADHLAHRPASYQFWTDMAQNRTLMEREGRILLLAGFLDPSGEMRVECWTAGPETASTDSFFLLAGQVWQSEGVTMTQLNIPETQATAATEILVSRITPPAPMQPPLAASDGLRTTTIFPMREGSL